MVKSYNQKSEKRRDEMLSANLHTLDLNIEFRHQTMEEFHIYYIYNKFQLFILMI